ncbi:hypothetical protein XENTR_v10019262 [Xenopus tropicalis]|nr:hypothetical protein XENTR_v10019262 [Xenopus tropicalis]
MAKLDLILWVIFYLILSCNSTRSCRILQNLISTVGWCVLFLHLHPTSQKNTVMEKHFFPQTHKLIELLQQNPAF